MTDSSRHGLGGSEIPGPRPTTSRSTSTDSSRVTLAIEVYVRGDGDNADSWRESINWCNQNKGTAEAHEVVAVLAMTLARIHWADADRIRSAAARRRR